MFLKSKAKDSVPHVRVGVTNVIAIMCNLISKDIA